MPWIQYRKSIVLLHLRPPLISYYKVLANLSISSFFSTWSPWKVTAFPLFTCHPPDDNSQISTSTPDPSPEHQTHPSDCLMLFQLNESKSKHFILPHAHTFPYPLNTVNNTSIHTAGQGRNLPTSHTQKPIYFVYQPNLIKNVLQENSLPKSLVLCGTFNYVDEIVPVALSSGSQPFTQILCPVSSPLYFPFPAF